MNEECRSEQDWKYLVGFRAGEVVDQRAFQKLEDLKYDMVAGDVGCSYLFLPEIVIDTFCSELDSTQFSADFSTFRYFDELKQIDKLYFESKGRKEKYQIRSIILHRVLRGDFKDSEECIWVASGSLKVSKLNKLSEGRGYNEVPICMAEKDSLLSLKGILKDCRIECGSHHCHIIRFDLHVMHCMISDSRTTLPCTRVYNRPYTTQREESENGPTDTFQS